jgi:hypothetical protein
VQGSRIWSCRFGTLGYLLEGILCVKGMLGSGVHTLDASSSVCRCVVAKRFLLVEIPSMISKR